MDLNVGDGKENIKICFSHFIFGFTCPNLTLTPIILLS